MKKASDFSKNLRTQLCMIEEILLDNTPKLLEEKKKQQEMSKILDQILKGCREHPWTFKKKVGVSEKKLFFSALAYLYSDIGNLTISYDEKSAEIIVSGKALTSRLFPDKQSVVLDPARYEIVVDFFRPFCKSESTNNDGNVVLSEIDFGKARTYFPDFNKLFSITK